MALIDFLQSAEKITNSPAGAENALTTTDIVMAQAAKTQENRMRREELQRKIDNLRKQNDELKALRESLKASTSLANLDEDKIVAIAKAKGIKDEDIDTWLRARAQRSARSVSAGQQKALESQAEAMREQNKANDAQAIFEADAEYTRAFEEARTATDEKAASTDKNVLAKKNKLDTLKHQFFKNYGIKWEEFAKTEDAPKSASEGDSEDKTVAEVVDVTLTTEEEEALKGNKKTRDLLTKFNERDTTNKEKRSVKQTAQNIINDKAEAERQRKEQLAGIKADLATIGAKSGMDAAKIVNGFDRSTDRNDPVKRAAVARLKKFVGADKDFKNWKSLDTLFK